MDRKKEQRVVHQGSYIIENTFVNGEFKYGVLNNMRNYLEFEDKEDMAKEMERRLTASESGR